MAIPMQTRPLGNSDLDITPLGIGAWAMGGAGWAFSWGAQDDKDSIDAIHAALDAGLNWIDTAAVYGLGHSEEVVGQAVKGRANRPYVFTKCARVWDENRQIGKRLKADSVRTECEASLRRLQVEGACRFFLDEAETSRTLLDAVPAERSPQDRVLVFVGPEGGWTDAERMHAAAAGWSQVTLGPQILRAETAAMAALAVVGAAWLGNAR